ncbi:MAG: glutamate--tRNA ligase [Clostridia bacterium]|nr:glutamate--tRNA ligase [Clostridia bacterium]
MDNQKLANLLFPNIKRTPEDYEAFYPQRNLPKGAKVTRLGPSPTGFIHLGNLYGALADERLAHQSEGICILRIEDTDEKREVEGAVPALLSSLSYFGIKFDEGATFTGEVGKYGPYYQSNRADVYQCLVKHLIAQGLAYPCFMSEEEVAQIREGQEAQKANPGIYGEYAKHRSLSFEDVVQRLGNGEEFVVRFRSEGNAEKYFTIIDGIRGEVSMPENIQDVVILKKSGLPTYHFAHVVDDHFMRITHIVRGEEWLSSLPIHVQLFDALKWQPPIFCHNTVLMKIDEETGQKRKLSKRKDPELSLEYYKKEGYFPEAVMEYLMTILNSDYEEWRMSNPDETFDGFEFSAGKMSNSGTLFDLQKLNDVSKDVLAKKSAEEILAFMLAWANAYQPALAGLMAEHSEMLLKVFDIDRGGEKPRKDLVNARQTFTFVSYFFDEHFMVQDDYPKECSPKDIKEILRRYLAGYNENDNNEEWFEKVRAIAQGMGYALKPKDYKKNPEDYKGHIGHVSNVIRIAITGRSSSPDLWTVQQIMGSEMVKRRIAEALGVMD